MTPEQWRRVRVLFDVAQGLPPRQRAAFLRNACAEEPALRAEVESLLRSAEVAGDEFLEAGALREVTWPGALGEARPAAAASPRPGAEAPATPQPVRREARPAAAPESVREIAPPPPEEEDEAFPTHADAAPPPPHTPSVTAEPRGRRRLLAAMAATALALLLLAGALVARLVRQRDRARLETARALSSLGELLCAQGRTGEGAQHLAAAETTLRALGAAGGAELRVVERALAACGGPPTSPR